MTINVHPMELLVVINVGPSWQNVDRLRTAVLHCIAAMVDNCDASETVGNVVSELLENAIKYGDWSRKDQSPLRLHIEGDLSRTLVEVESPIDPKSSSYEKLCTTLEWIRSFKSTEDAYRERMQQVAAGDDGSRMGLVRIAHEGQCTITARLSDAGRLAVIAEMRLSSNPTT